jgi:uncharacterized phage-like protein YoqJ
MLAVRLKKELTAKIDTAIAFGYRRFIYGGALGVDTWAGEIVADLAQWYAIHDDIKIYLELYSPFEGQEVKWKEEDQMRYFNLMARCDKVVEVCEPGYAAWKMQKRNEAMVDASDLVIAVWDGTDGGTANCVRYAEKQGKQIVRINPKEL